MSLTGDKTRRFVLQNGGVGWPPDTRTCVMSMTAQARGDGGLKARTVSPAKVAAILQTAPAEAKEEA